MPLTQIATAKDGKPWTYEEYKAPNMYDPYSACVIKVTEKVSELLDAIPESQPFSAEDLVTEADRVLNEGITGFMAGCVAQGIAKFHTRGEEFRRSWNKENQIGTEGDKANESTGVLNPALLVIGNQDHG